MSNCYQKARELGQMILESEESIRVADAMAVYKQSPVAQRKLDSYKNLQKEMQVGIKNGSLTGDGIKKASAELAELAAELKKDPIVGALIFAENEYNAFVNGVLGILKQTIMGEAATENGCSGNCSAKNCAGCH